jgi:polyhydroxybutyrate depolymerase
MTREHVISMKKCILLALAISLTASSCGTWRERDSRGCAAVEISHKGQQRKFLLHLPADFSGSKKIPLLIILHGGGSGPEGMIRLTGGRFNALSDEKGFIAVYPYGLYRHWNDYRKEPIDRAHREKMDDVGFISALIDRMTADYGCDPERVFAAGISNGGFMCYRLACELPGKIRAIAAVSATNPAGTDSICRPARGVDVMIINGTKDPLVPYGGGRVRVFGIDRGEVLSTGETVKFWAKVNNCGMAETIEVPGKSPAGATRLTILRHACPNGRRVILYSVDGGGHTWPGGRQYLPKSIIGETNTDIDACDEIWNFFNTSR